MMAIATPPETPAAVPNPPRRVLFVCMACGRRSNDRYGDNPVDKGWDANCCLNAVPAYEDHLEVSDERATRIKPNGIVMETDDNGDSDT